MLVMLMKKGKLSRLLMSFVVATTSCCSGFRAFADGVPQKAIQECECEGGQTTKVLSGFMAGVTAVVLSWILWQTAQQTLNLSIQDTDDDLEDMQQLQ
ncbi:MAG: hypothetical protein LBJ38_01845 [Oscillospiraceae bacterium]|jgi:hypothetical protein|nr:hypothetical protein [Oscillospiraceae bacterium]